MQKLYQKKILKVPEYMTTHIINAKKHFANVPTKFHDDDADAKYKVHHRWIVQLDQFGQECDQ